MFERICNIILAAGYYIGWTWIIVIAVVIIWAVIMYVRQAIAHEVASQENALRTLDRDENV